MVRQAGSSALHPQNAPTRLLLVSSPADPDPAPAAGRLRGARREQDPALPPRGQGSAGFLSSALNSVGGPETQVSRRKRGISQRCSAKREATCGAGGLGASRGSSQHPWSFPGLLSRLKVQQRPQCTPSLTTPAAKCTSHPRDRDITALSLFSELLSIKPREHAGFAAALPGAGKHLAVSSASPAALPCLCHPPCPPRSRLRPGRFLLAGGSFPQIWHPVLQRGTSWPWPCLK